MKIPLLFFLLTTVHFIFISGCSKEIRDEQSVTFEAESDPKPFAATATFIGTIPCDDCLRVDIVLNIRPDGLYQLRKTYVKEQGEPEINSQLGIYRYLPETKLLILGKEIGLLKTYVIEDQNRLRFVEWQGSEAKAQIRYELTRQTAVDPFEDVVKIRGLFNVAKEIPQFRECSSQLMFPVNRGGDYPVTLQNYMNTPHDMNRAILVSILGSLVNKGQEEVVIDQFRKFYPDSDCQGNKVTTSLTGTHWQLFEADAQKWSEISTQMAYLLLKRDRSFEGYTGCNKITGTYLLKSDVLLISRGVSSRKACPGSMEGENILVSVLDDTEAYRITNNILELIDQNDQVLARFLAGP